MVKMKYLLGVLFIFSYSVFAKNTRTNYVSEVWVSDLGNGKYKNPVLNADYSDPDVCRVGEDFYMTASSFNCSPGLPVLHSTDLVNWSIVNYALPKLEPVDFFDKPQHGKGVWAPCIRYHKGEFYIYYGDPDYGIFMVKADNPVGEWSDPVLVKAGKGLIDPSPLFDENGKAYLIHGWAGSRSGLNSILTVSEMNGEGTKVIGREILVYDGLPDGNHTVEGPKFYKHNGWYYIFAPAGGVQTGWQLVLRSKNIYGPYESRIVMHQGNTNINGPHQGGWVDTSTGENWFIHFQDKGVYGRVVHLQPMEWIDEWPIIGIDKNKDGIGEPVSVYNKPKTREKSPIATPAESDEFNNTELGLQWQWYGNGQDMWVVPSNTGNLRMYSGYTPDNFRSLFDIPNLLLQKFPAEEFSAITKITFYPFVEGERSGLVVMGLDYAALSLVKKGDRLFLQQETSLDNDKTPHPKVIADIDLLPIIKEPFSIRTSPLYLKVEVGKDAICKFMYSIDGKKFIPIGEPFRTCQGKWIGAKVGLYSLVPHSLKQSVTRGYVDYDWFRVKKNR